MKELLFLILFILFNNLLSSSNLKNDICCLYIYYEKNELYKNNFEYFLENGILDNIDYYIIINGESSIKIPFRNNIKIYKRENKGFDFGAYSYGIKKLNKQYNYYFFINTSVIGPYFKNKGKDWTKYFIKLFNKDVKLVGTSINIYTYNRFCEYNLQEIYKKKNCYSHVQTMFFCIDKEYLNYLNNIHFFNEEELNNQGNINYVVAYKEFGLSQIALNNGWNINSILPKYKDKDYRTITSDFNFSSRNGDPYFKNSYFGEDIDKNDVIFFKSNRNF